jgi:peptide/nickel transport system substrate-binding protein
LCASLLAATTASGGNTAPTTSKQTEARKGGTFRILGAVDFDHVDPALAYLGNSWELGGATQLRLYYFPYVDGPRSERIEPMAAAGMPRVSDDGRTYTIRIKPGFRFSNGQAVTAASFKRAFDRAKSEKLQSPAASFLGDVSGVRTAGDTTLVITLTRVAPDLLPRMTMPFFSAVPASAPLDAEMDSAPLHSAGPYYLAEWSRQVSALTVRNPYWNPRREPWKSLGFQSNVDRITWAGRGGSAATHRLQCERSEADACGFPPTQAKELADRYGINKGRFFVANRLLVWRLDLNNEQPLFRSNPKLRQAVAHAIDRRFMLAQHGFMAGRRTDQNLPYGMPGFREVDIYSLKGPNLAKARRLAEGNTRSGKAILYASNRGAGPPVAQSVQFNLEQIGLEVEIKLFAPLVATTKMSIRGEPFDIGLTGWTADYPDPSNFLNVLLDGRHLQSENNVNTAYYTGDGVSGFARKLDAAYTALGAERLDLYAQLDRELSANGVPSATYMSGRSRFFVGPDVGCFLSHHQVAIVLVNVCKK